nr:ras-specific guanine nucleotide-releasing factor RalGPS2 [Chelonoidis abingdonii]
MYMILEGLPEKDYVCVKCRLIEQVETLVEFRRGFEEMMERRQEGAEESYCGSAGLVVEGTEAVVGAVPHYIASPSDHLEMIVHYSDQGLLLTISGLLPSTMGPNMVKAFRKYSNLIHSGIYLSDLTYIDSAYPSTGSILESEQRSNLMNNILRIISDFQQSCEYDILLLPHVQKYLNSVQYIEELQKFVEDDNYKLSLKIEPGTSTPRSAASREDLVGSEVGASPQSARKNVAAEGALLPPTPPSPRNLIPHGHRKCHSLGYNFIHKMNTAEFKSATFPNAGPRHLLDDSVMEPHAPSRGQAESSTLSSGISIGSSDGSELSEETSWPAFERNRLYHSLGPVTRVARNGYRGHMKASSSAESEDLAVHLYPGAVTIQGVLRRKTLLKEGKKPTVASWTKYWAALCGTQLFYYAAKSLKATERKHFKSTPSKNVSVVGWMVMMADDPEHPDLFLLTDSEKGNSYKFQAGNRMNAMLWFKHLSAACQSNRQQVPANLMSFE